MLRIINRKLLFTDIHIIDKIIAEIFVFINIKIHEKYYFRQLLKKDEKRGCNFLYSFIYGH